MPLKRYAQRMARLDALAAVFEPRVRKALIQGCEAAADAFAAGASPAIAAALVRNGYLVAVLEDLYERAGLAEAQDEYDHLTTRYPRKALPDLLTRNTWAGRLRRFVRTEGAASIRAITATVRGKVRAVLQSALDAGQGIADAARALRAEVAAFSGQHAITICRTELLAASNYGSLMGAEATGLPLDKFWMATPGPRTRPAHREADRQTVGLQQFFTVGGEPARYPGDPLLSAAQRIRCRCSIGYKPKE